MNMVTSHDAQPYVVLYKHAPGGLSNRLVVCACTDVGIRTMPGQCTYLYPLGDDDDGDDDGVDEWYC